MTKIPGRRHRRRPPLAGVAALALAGALGTAAGSAEAQQGAPATSSTTGAGQSTVGDTGQGNSLPMPANPAGQTGRTPMQNQSNPGAAAAGGADSSPDAGTTARKQLPPEPGQSAGQYGSGRVIEQGGQNQSGQQQMLQPQAGGGGGQQGAAGGQQPAGGGQQRAAPSVELQSSSSDPTPQVTRQSLEPQPRTGNGPGPDAPQANEPGGQVKVAPGGGGGGTTAGGIPVAPQGSGTR